MSEVDLLVLGGTGLAGRAIMASARRRNLNAIAVARGGELPVDVRDEGALVRALADVRPRVIVNAAAIVSAPACERDPAATWLVNARPAAIVASHARATGARFAQISTDHYYSGDGRRRHAEDEPVRLINEYGRSKYAAEAFALTAPDAIVLRTNFVGWPSVLGSSFAEWAMGVIEQDLPADLYDDQFVSSLDVWTFADGVLDLACGDALGVVNLGAGEVFSKAEFVQALAARMARPLTRARLASVGLQQSPRGDSLGLDVSRAEGILGHPLPGLEAVITSLMAHLEDRRS
ncbi:MAG: sugar nucleotide-binding protein [Caulobacteraceae bacterium]|nr:sugar nucleotide-binding protein [Caulobacteraceae bacterium]